MAIELLWWVSDSPLQKKHSPDLPPGWLNELNQRKSAVVDENGEKDEPDPLSGAGDDVVDDTSSSPEPTRTPTS